MRARGVHTFDDYAQLLDQDGHEYDLLLDALTINVTKFYRNAETWRALEPWLDGLWKARRGDVRAWSAGCASGDRKSTRLNSSHLVISYAVFCLKKKTTATARPASCPVSTTRAWLAQRQSPQPATHADLRPELAATDLPAVLSTLSTALSTHSTS